MEKIKKLWGTPPIRIYKYLRLVTTNFPTDKIKKMCFLGASDGTDVLPAARKGFVVTAIDIDKTALYGGIINISGKKTIVEGLNNKVVEAGLVNKIKIVNSDFVTYKHKEQFEAVFTSGSIQYRYNTKYSLQHIIGSIKSYVAPEGFLLLEYMLPYKTGDKKKRYLITKNQMVSFFDSKEWLIISHRTSPPHFESGHPGDERPHYHVWCRLLCKRRK